MDWGLASRRIDWGLASKRTNFDWAERIMYYWDWAVRRTHWDWAESQAKGSLHCLGGMC